MENQQNLQRKLRSVVDDTRLLATNSFEILSNDLDSLQQTVQNVDERVKSWGSGRNQMVIVAVGLLVFIIIVNSNMGDVAKMWMMKLFAGVVGVSYALSTVDIS